MIDNDEKVIFNFHFITFKLIFLHYISSHIGLFTVFTYFQSNFGGALYM